MKYKKIQNSKRRRKTIITHMQLGDQYAVKYYQGKEKSTRKNLMW